MSSPESLYSEIRIGFTGSPAHIATTVEHIANALPSNATIIDPPAWLAEDADPIPITADDLYNVGAGLGFKRVIAGRTFSSLMRPWLRYEHAQSIRQSGEVLLSHHLDSLEIPAWCRAHVIDENSFSLQGLRTLAEEGLLQSFRHMGPKGERLVVELVAERQATRE